VACVIAVITAHHLMKTCDQTDKQRSRQMIAKCNTARGSTLVMLPTQMTAVIGCDSVTL
jgi:hypothetical protein